MNYLFYDFTHVRFKFITINIYEGGTITTRRKLRNLLGNLTLLETLGSPLTIQIELNEVSGIEQYLQHSFQNSSGIGFYTSGVIILEYSPEETRYEETLNELINIAGEFDIIDTVTALVSIPLNDGTNIEASIQIDETNNPPHILATADNSLYFQIARLVQMRWSVGKNLQLND